MSYALTRKKILFFTLPIPSTGFKLRWYPSFSFFRKCHSFWAYLWHERSPRRVQLLLRCKKVFCSFMLVFNDSNGVSSNSFCELQAKMEKIGLKVHFCSFSSFTHNFGISYFQDPMWSPFGQNNFFVCLYLFFRFPNWSNLIASFQSKQKDLCQKVDFGHFTNTSLTPL